MFTREHFEVADAQTGLIPRRPREHHSHSETPGNPLPMHHVRINHWTIFTGTF